MSERVVTQISLKLCQNVYRNVLKNAREKKQIIKQTLKKQQPRKIMTAIDGAVEKIFNMDILAFNVSNVWASCYTNIIEIMPERLKKYPKKYKRKKTNNKADTEKTTATKNKWLPLTHFSSKESHLESFFKK